MTTSDLGIDVSEEGSRAVAALRGEIDYGNVAQLRSSLLGLSQGSATEVVVDMAGVTFVDSTALSVLVQAKQRLAESGRQMSIIDPQPRVIRVLRLAGLSDYLGDD
ncbi:MAG TPA: STAS domain-containing protein [Acidimicrobiia bacterium]|nr:STAS domain-containing protein [Acidimicrobiia bacterium]